MCCMKSMRRFCYKDYDACEEYEENPIKHRYYIVMDSQVICHYEDKIGIHPVYAIHLMGNDLSEKWKK